MSLSPVRNFFHRLYPLLAWFRYGKLGTRIPVIGITGTDGKSSSVILIAAMLRAAGHTVAHYSSVSIHDGVEERTNEAKMTTPGRMGLHRFLAGALRHGADYAVVEITSQGILQHRHRGIGFMLVGITNITPEHIEAHGGYEKYRDAKLSLIRELLPKRNLGIVVGTEALAKEISSIPRFARLHLVCANASPTSFSTSLPGPFMARNVSFAATVASTLGVSPQAIEEAFTRQSPIPGRYEVVSEHPLVIVDYAHTLAALEELLPYVRARTEGKLIHVFGAAGGGRDRYKRPLLAKLSEKFADISIVTEENPFDDIEASINADILAGFSPEHEVRSILPRSEAAKLANTLAGPRDTVLLTGKGSETVTAGPKGTRRPYTERDYVRCLFETSSSA